MRAAFALLVLAAPLRAAQWAATSDALMRYPLLAGLEQTQGNVLGFGTEVFRFQLAQHGPEGRFFVIEKVGEPPDAAAALARDREALLAEVRRRNAPPGALCHSAGASERELPDGSPAVLDDFGCEAAGRRTPRPIVLFASELGLFAAVGGGVSIEEAAAAVWAGGPVPAAWKAAAVRTASPPGRLRLPDGRLELPKPEGFELYAEGMRGPRALLAVSDARRRFLMIEKLREDPEAEDDDWEGPELLADAARELAERLAPGGDCSAEEAGELEALAGWSGYALELDCPALRAAGLERSGLAFLAKEGTVYKATGFGLPLAELTGILAGASEPGEPPGDGEPDSGWLLWLIPGAVVLALAARALKRRRAPSPKS